MIRFLVKHRNSVFAVAGISVYLLLLYSTGFASGAAESGGEHGSGKLIDLVYRLTNFSLLVIVLFVVFRKTSIKDFFSARREEIRKRFDDLERKKYEVEKNYEELEKKLKEIEIRKKEIIEQFKSDGIIEKEKIVNEAKKKAALIIEKADSKIQQEIEMAKERLRQEIVDIAAQKAKEIITKDIKESDHDYLVTEFIERLEKLH